MKILVGCEESQAVTIELRKLGHEAYSCDLLPCSGGHPEWHLQMDVFKAIKMTTWDMGIFHPECTRLTVTANKWYKPEFADRFPTIHEDREKAVDFFMNLVNCGIPKIAIENPIGIMSTRYRKPDQIIQPWQFGHGETKATCLWLKNLPPLTPTNIVEGREARVHKMAPGPDRWKERSRTFEGIAQAMADQWGPLL